MQLLFLAGKASLVCKALCTCTACTHQCHPCCGAETRLPPTLNINYARANALRKISTCLFRHCRGRLSYSSAVTAARKPALCSVSPLAEPRGGKDQAPILTKWWREMVPVVLVEPVEEVELFLHSSSWSQKSRNPQHEVFCRAPPPLPGPNRSYQRHPALMPALLLPFPRKNRAQLIHAPQNHLDTLSPVPCTAPPAARGVLHQQGRTISCSRGYSDAKGCWN